MISHLYETFYETIHAERTDVYFVSAAHTFLRFFSPHPNVNEVTWRNKEKTICLPVSSQY